MAISKLTESGWHLEATTLLPVDPAGSTESTLHVGWSPRIPLVGRACCVGNKTIQTIQTIAVIH